MRNRLGEFGSWPEVILISSVRRNPVGSYIALNKYPFQKQVAPPTWAAVAHGQNDLSGAFTSRLAARITERAIRRPSHVAFWTWS